eukprot:151797_1
MPKRDKFNFSKAIVKAHNFKKSNSAKQELKEYKSILKNLSKYALGVYQSHDFNYRYTCLQKIRRLVSFADPPPPLNAVINTGIIPQLIYILHFNTRPKLQHESLWILTNIASGNTKQTRLLVKNNVVPSLKRILTSKYTNNEIKSQAMWCIGNIVGDSIYCRNLLFVKYNIFHDCVIPILTCNTCCTNKIIQIDMTDKNKMELFRNTSWTISNFCRKASKKVFFEQRKPIINLFNFLLAVNDIQILSDICWAISFFVNNRHDQRCKLVIDEMFEKGIILKLINNHIMTDAKICHPTIRTLGNIIASEKSYTNEWTLKMIDLGILNKYKIILTSKDKQIPTQREILWTLSNMAANKDRFDEIIGAIHDNNLFHSVMSTLKCSKFSTRKEAAWIMGNVISHCDSIKQLECINDKSFVIVFLLRLFRCDEEIMSIGGWDSTFGFMVLETIGHLLDLGKKFNNYKFLYNALRCQGLEILENMQQGYVGKNKEFVEKVNEIIKLLKDQENDDFYLVKCCNDKCNKTKYVNGYETSSVNDCESSSVSSESGVSRVKVNRFYRCKKCNSAVYCSKKCQKWHWKNGHKYLCRELV